MSKAIADTKRERPRRMTSAERVTRPSMPFHGQILRELREAAGMTQAELAAKIDWPLATLKSWEQGRRAPQLDAVLALAKVLGVAAEAFVQKPATKDNRKPGRPSK